MADFKVEGIIEVDSSRAVRDLQKFNSQLKSTFTQTKAVVKAVKDLDGMRARVNLDAEKAKADAAAIKRDIEELKRQKAEIDVTVRAAKAELELRRIQNQVNKLDQTKADVEIGMHGPYTEIAELEMAIRSIDETDVSIEVELDAMKAVREAAALNAELDALIDNNKVIDVEVNTSGFDRLKAAISGATMSLGAPGMMGTLIGGLVLLGSTLGPLVGALGGVAAGMVGSTSVMGASVVAFGALAAPTIKEVMEGFKLLNTEVKDLSPEKLEEYNKKMGELKKETPGIYRAAQAVKKLKDRFMELSEEIRPIVLDAFTYAVGAANVVLEGMAPVAEEAGKAIRDLMKDAKEGLKGEEWQTFFTYLKDNAREFIGVWGETWGNFITGIANMIAAFDPLTRFVNQGFLDMSERFRNWSKNLGDNEGFKKFVSWVKSNAPIVWDNIKKIADAIAQIFIAAAPLGMGVLKTIGNLAEKFSTWAKANPDMATMAVAIAAVSAAVIPLVSPLASLVGPMVGIMGALGMAGAVVGGVLALVGALGLIGVGFALVTDTGEPFKQMWQAIMDLWESLKESASRVKERLQELWDFLKEKGAIENFQFAIRDLAAAFEEMLPFLELMATILGGALLVGIYTVGAGFRVLAGAIRFVVESFKTVIEGAKRIPEAFQKAKDWAIQKWSELRQRMIELTRQIVEGVKQKFNDAKNAVKAKVEEIKNSVRQKFEEVKNAIRDKVNSAVQTIKTKFSEAKQAVVSKMQEMVASARAKAQEILNAIRDKFNQIKSTVSEKISAAKQTLQSKFQEMVSAARNKAAEIIQSIRTKLAQAKAVVTGAFAGAGGWLLSAGRAIIDGLLGGIGEKFNAVKEKLSSLTKLIPDWKGPAKKDKELLRPVGKMIMDSLIKGFDDGTEGVKNVLGKITKLITDTMNKRYEDDKVAAAKTQQVIKALDDEAAAMMRNAKQRENVMAKIDKQKEKLEGLIQAQKQYAESVRDSVMQFGSVGGLGTREDEEGNQIGPTAGTIVEDMKKKLDEAKTYKEYMNQLIAMDLNKDTLDQLTNMGVEAGLATAKAIIDGGAATVEEINILTEQLKLTGQQMGDAVSKEMYGAGVQATEGVIKGLRSKKAELIQVAKNLARAMTKAFQAELKIKSPSRVFIDFGHMTGQGLVKGLKDEIPKVESATKSLTDSMNNMKTNPLGWAQNFSVNDTHANSKENGGSGEGATPPVEVKVFIGDRELTDIVRVEVGDTIKPLRKKTRQGAI